MPAVTVSLTCSVAHQRSIPHPAANEACSGLEPFGQRRSDRRQSASGSTRTHAGSAGHAATFAPPGIGPRNSSQARRCAVASLPFSFDRPVPRRGSLAPSTDDVHRCGRRALRSVSGSPKEFYRPLCPPKPKVEKNVSKAYQTVGAQLCRVSGWRGRAYPRLTSLIVRSLGIEPRTCGLRVRCSAS